MNYLFRHFSSYTSFSQSTWDHIKKQFDRMDLFPECRETVSKYCPYSFQEHTFELLVQYHRFFASFRHDHLSAKDSPSVADSLLHRNLKALDQEKHANHSNHPLRTIVDIQEYFIFLLPHLLLELEFLMATHISHHEHSTAQFLKAKSLCISYRFSIKEIQGKEKDKQTPLYSFIHYLASHHLLQDQPSYEARWKMNFRDHVSYSLGFLFSLYFRSSCAPSFLSSLQDLNEYYTISEHPISIQVDPTAPSFFQKLTFSFFPFEDFSTEEFSRFLQSSFHEKINMLRHRQFQSVSHHLCSQDHSEISSCKYPLGHLRNPWLHRRFFHVPPQLDYHVPRRLSRASSTVADKETSIPFFRSFFQFHLLLTENQPLHQEEASKCLLLQSTKDSSFCPLCRAHIQQVMTQDHSVHHNIYHEMKSSSCQLKQQIFSWFSIEKEVRKQVAHRDHMNQELSKGFIPHLDLINQKSMPRDLILSYFFSIPESRTNDLIKDFYESQPITLNYSLEESQEEVLDLDILNDHDDTSLLGYHLQCLPKEDHHPFLGLLAIFYTHLVFYAEMRQRKESFSSKLHDPKTLIFSKWLDMIWNKLSFRDRMFLFPIHSPCQVRRTFEMLVFHYHVAPYHDDFYFYLKDSLFHQWRRFTTDPKAKESGSGFLHMETILKHHAHIFHPLHSFIADESMREHMAITIDKFGTAKYLTPLHDLHKQFHILKEIMKSCADYFSKHHL